MNRMSVVSLWEDLKECFTAGKTMERDMMLCMVRNQL
jgi:hypothetical protein